MDRKKTQAEYTPPKNKAELEKRFQETVRIQRQHLEEYKRQNSMEYLIQKGLEEYNPREVTDDQLPQAECTCSCHPREYQI